MAQDYERLLARVERLERRNRLLTGSLMVVPLLAVAGWQAAPDVLRVRRLEIVDARGVPLVALHADRGDEGGAITLRDKNGERRAWWQVAPDGGRFTMTSPDEATAGVGVTGKSARMTLGGPGGSSANMTLEGEAPRVDLWGKNGRILFGAPWRK